MAPVSLKTRISPTFDWEKYDSDRLINLNAISLQNAVQNSTTSGYKNFLSYYSSLWKEELFPHSSQENENCVYKLNTKHFEQFS